MIGSERLSTIVFSRLSMTYLCGAYNRTAGKICIPGFVFFPQSGYCELQVFRPFCAGLRLTRENFDCAGQKAV